MTAFVNAQVCLFIAMGSYWEIAGGRMKREFRLNFQQSIKHAPRLLDILE